MRKLFKVICCSCGHLHIHHTIDSPLEACKACGVPLAVDQAWEPHSVRIFVEDADPKLVRHFVAEVKSKRKAPRKAKRSPQRPSASRSRKKVA